MVVGDSPCESRTSPGKQRVPLMRYSFFMFRKDRKPKNFKEISSLYSSEAGARVGRSKKVKDANGNTRVVFPFR
jgi:hypothetical protein